VQANHPQSSQRQRIQDEVEIARARQLWLRQRGPWSPWR
jgi:hypothetical protein